MQNPLASSSPLTTHHSPWYFIGNLETVDSPALVLYKDRVIENIRLAITMVPDVSCLRPHVKTNKIAEVCQLMLDAGITKFKCATIAEAEMLGMIKAPDVLLAYQPVGPKIQRLVKLMKAYPATHFSCVLDDASNATEISALMVEKGLRLPVFIDLNVGMNRTGTAPAKAYALFENCTFLPGLEPVGLHAYDGHIHDTDIIVRKQKADAVFEQVTLTRQEIEAGLQRTCGIVISGTPGFPMHAQRPGVECSPGTFVFWDWGYKIMLPDESFSFAALVITRVISVIDPETICVDLGHKSVAAENPLPRVHFLNAPEAIAVSQSEEHLVLKVAAGNKYRIGDALYGVPVHICPTVALYEEAFVVEDYAVTAVWNVIARNRKINV